MPGLQHLGYRLSLVVAPLASLALLALLSDIIVSPSAQTHAGPCWALNFDITGC